MQRQKQVNIERITCEEWTVPGYIYREGSEEIEAEKRAELNTKIVDGEEDGSSSLYRS